MALVSYSDSEDEDSAPPPAKKVKTSTTLPPLPATFRDLYSSTVRTSTQDDPALHGGRKRVVPHVQGNWPTHVYLEWCPEPEEYDALSQLVEAQRSAAKGDVEVEHSVHSLLHNHLGVSLPLHISLSRPLVLKTEQKDGYLQRLKQSVSSTGSAHAFDVSLADLKWHPNEDRTRWFLVTRVADAHGELLKLLQTCNSVATAYDQPRLYEDDNKDASPEALAASVVDKFHISIAWSLRPPATASSPKTEESTSLLDKVRDLRVHFADVKVRIGQDVTSIALATRRQRKGS